VNRPMSTFLATLILVDFSQVHLRGVQAADADGQRAKTPEELRGVIASGLHRGADAVYFFNLIASPYQRYLVCSTTV